MKRRTFIQVSSLSLAALMVEGCKPSESYPIEFRNDMPTGHLIMESDQFPVRKKLRAKYLIVGGGVAGLSAAYQLRNENFLLCELSDNPGGTSSSGKYKNTPLCFGAHYDLSYPANYGPKALKMLEELNIIQFDSFMGSWNFTEKQYLIPKNRESITYDHGTMRKDVLPDEPGKSDFRNLMRSYYGCMPMPTRLIDKTLHGLNEISFRSWLEQKLTLSDSFYAGIDYNMKDDYGSGSETVSALAGIHYYACRPYIDKPVELFSPPEGNAYFIRKILSKLPKSRILSAHLVMSVKEKGDGFEVSIVDVVKRETTILDCEKIVYAGQKHALKYIYPKDYPLFEHTAYAPWAVVNFVLKTSWPGDVYWQNEIISDDRSLLGFVDSAAQYTQNPDHRVLTVYYCFKPEEREMMSLIESHKEVFTNGALNPLEKYFNRSLKKDIEKVFITQMGHAMPIPKPDYLFSEPNSLRSNPNLVYAGVDCGRLPLLFEALDSGICAVDEINGINL
jgi:protoporphyrinogen oxidase